jgi:hypothetical protein
MRDEVSGTSTFGIPLLLVQTSLNKPHEVIFLCLLSLLDHNSWTFLCPCSFGFSFVMLFNHLPFQEVHLDSLQLDINQASSLCYTL